MGIILYIVHSLLLYQNERTGTGFDCPTPDFNRSSHWSDISNTSSICEQIIGSQEAQGSREFMAKFVYHEDNSYAQRYALFGNNKDTGYDIRLYTDKTILVY